MYYTTLNKIRAHSPCSEGWARLLRSLEKANADDEPLALATILESNGIDDAVWALRAVDGIDSIARLFAIRCVREHFQHRITDLRSLAALDVAEMYAIGEATDDELRDASDAAWVAAEYASNSAAWVAARHAASAAASATASATAWYAAWYAAWNAERHAAWDAERTEARDVIEADFRAIFCEPD